ncbi:MAG TPA: ester cyclase [Pyrinomonadaceae bacterium]|nr:ester cyclase [Pyrinomonadaceae bacterium]
MSEENKTLMRRWFEEVWNKGREEAIDEMFAEDGVANGLADESGEPLRGASGFKPFFHKFREAFPEIEVVVEDVISEGDKVAARCTVRGRHRGDTLGFAATDQPVEFTGMTITRIRDGKIVEAWNNFDFMAMFQQLGALSLSAPEKPDEKV